MDSSSSKSTNATVTVANAISGGMAAGLAQALAASGLSTPFGARASRPPNSKGKASSVNQYLVEQASLNAAQSVTRLAPAHFNP